jgi:predicted aspartyl protease
MLRFLSSFLLLLVVAFYLWPTTADAYFTGEQTHVITMQEWHGHVWVDILINGDRTKAIVDTGCDTIAIPPSLASRLNLTLTATGKQVAMYDRQSKGQTAIVRDIRIGDLALQNQQVDVVEYPYVIIGLSVLGKYACTFDFDHSRLVLAPSQANDPAGLPMTPFWGLYAVQGTLSGQPQTFVVDTGADTTIVSKQTVANIPRTRLSASPQHRLTYCRFQQIRIGNHAVNYPELAVYDQPDTQNNTAVNTGAIMLGLPFWQRYNVTFDFPAQRLVLSNRGRV